MTKPEIIEQLKSLKDYSWMMISEDNDEWKKDCEALDYAISALENE